jgi:1,3-beta-glucan synthase
MKQSKLRRKRVFRYAILYFVMLIVFVGLIVGPLVAGKKIPASVINQLKGNDLMKDLLQPADQNNDDTKGRTQTGTGKPGYSGALRTMTTISATATATTSRGS